MTVIGCPKEIKPQENRVGLTPDGARKLVQGGHHVVVQRGAGEHAGFSDRMYQEAGAVLKSSAKDVWRQADILIKVKEPIKPEYKFLRYLKDKFLFTYLHLSAAPVELTKTLMRYKVHAIAYETVEDAKKNLPLLSPMSEVAGVLAVQYGAEYLQIKHKGRGITLSRITGTDTARVVVLGSGTVGSHAIMTAAGLGADVVVMQHTMSKAAALKKKYSKAIGATIAKNIRFVKATPENMAKETQNADLLVGAVLVKGARAPVLVSREMIREMKKGAVIVDVAIDQGGCIWGSKPTTHANPIYHLYEKVYNCVTNMPGQVALQSTQALTHATFPFLESLADKKMDALKGGFKKGLNVSNGKITCKAVAESLKMMKQFEEF